MLLLLNHPLFRKGTCLVPVFLKINVNLIPEDKRFSMLVYIVFTPLNKSRIWKVFLKTPTKLKSDLWASFLLF